MLLPLFKNRKGAVNIVLKGNTLVSFMGVREGGPLTRGDRFGRYFTSNEKHIAELKEMAKIREAGVFIDPNDDVHDTEATSAEEQIKAKGVREYLARQANVAKTVVTGNTGKSSGGNGISNSNHVASGLRVTEVATPAAVTEAPVPPMTVSSSNLGNLFKK